MLKLAEEDIVKYAATDNGQGTGIHRGFHV